MARNIVLPLRVHVELPVDLSADVLVPEYDIYIKPPMQTAPPPAVTPPPEPAQPPSPAIGSNVVANPPIGLTQWDLDAGKEIAYSIASLLNLAPPPYEIVIVFAVQAHHEDAGGDTSRSQGALYNNPLNLSDANGTITWPGQTGRYLDAFAKFDSLHDGARACAMNYVNGQAYANVIGMYEQNDYLGMALAIQNSPWDAGHYGANLVHEVRVALGIA